MAESCEDGNELSGSMKGGECLKQLLMFRGDLYQKLKIQYSEPAIKK